MVLALKWLGANIIPKKIKRLLKEYRFVFNPSFIQFKGLNYLAVRVFDEDTKSILSLLYIWDDNLVVKEVDLSKFFKEELNIKKVADVKLFVMDNNVWGSFNSGYEKTIDNNLVLFKMDKLLISNYYSCLYENRTRVEKNWAFYYHDNQIHALYSLNGLVVLKAADINKNEIRFVDEYSDDKLYFGAYTIGTPLALYNDNYIFIAHRKINRKGKRLYLGKPFLFKPSKKPQLTASKKYLIHSLKSLFGAKYKFNKFLISCTYFSGILISKNKTIVSYGINDVSWKIVKLNISRVWR